MIHRVVALELAMKRIQKDCHELAVKRKVVALEVLKKQQQSVDTLCQASYPKFFTLFRRHAELTLLANISVRRRFAEMFSWKRDLRLEATGKIFAKQFIRGMNKSSGKNGNCYPINSPINLWFLKMMRAKAKRHNCVFKTTIA